MIAERRRTAVRTRLLTLGLALLIAACGDDGAQSTGEDGGDDASATGLVTIRLEPVGGFFIEGFEVGLRFETADGEVIGSTLWSDFVTTQIDEPGPDDYYDSVYEQQVPAGDIVVFAEANVGMGPPPVTPDLDGDLPCRLDVAVPAGGVVDLEVSFSDQPGCLRTIS